MDFSIRSALLASCLSLTLAPGAFAAQGGSVTSQGSHPDASNFDIPMLPEPKNGFGGQLEDACAVLTASAFARSETDPAVTEGTALESMSSAMRKAPDPQSLATVTTQLADICRVLATGDPITQVQLEVLRSFEDSGAFPNLVAALDNQKGNGTLDRGKLAKDMRAPAGALQGQVGTPTVTGLESNLFNGLADFLITRSKEEAILYLQGEMADEFCKENRLKLLPNLCGTLKGLDPNLSIAAIGNALNAAARRDLAILPDGLLQIIADDDPDHLYLYEPLRMVYAVAMAAHQGRLPLELVRSLHALEPRTYETTNSPTQSDKQVREALDTVRVASALVYSALASNAEQVGEELAAHPVLAVGVLLEMESRYSKPFGGKRIVLVKPENINVLMDILSKAAGAITEWQQRQNFLLGANDGKVTSADRRRVLATALFDTLVRLNELERSFARILVTDPIARRLLLSSATIARDMAQLGRDLTAEDYGAISVDANALVGDISGTLEFSESATTTLRSTLKYTPLVAELASARSSADVTTALHAAAAPASSYRSKYQRGQVAINGLVGALVGEEIPNKPGNAILGNAKNSGAVAGFAPIGLEGTMPLSGMFYTGFMASVVDLGSLTTARFENQVSTGNNVTTTTNVTFGQIFSPGAHIVLGLFKSPFVLGGGVSYVPSLRTLQASDQSGNVTATEKVSTLRVGAFLAADVTLLPL